jgi:L-aspartate oxidase
MLREAGFWRDAKGLQRGLDELKRQMSFFGGGLTKREEYEFANLLTCAMLTTKAALRREESRGGHYRLDYPARDDGCWIRHIVFRLTPEGQLEESIQDAGTEPRTVAPQP